MVVMLHLASSFVTVVSQAGRQAVSQSGVWVGGLIKKILYLAADLCFLFLMLYLMLGGLILFCKGDFHSVRCL